MSQISSMAINDLSHINIKIKRWYTNKFLVEEESKPMQNTYSFHPKKGR